MRILIDFNDTHYKGVWLENDATNSNLHFYTGDVVADWATAVRHVPPDIVLVIHPSCDIFIEVHPGYDWDDNADLVKVGDNGK